MPEAMKPLMKIGDAYLNANQIIHVRPLGDGGLMIMTTGKQDNGKQYTVRIPPEQTMKVVSALDAYVGAHVIFDPQ